LERLAFLVDFARLAAAEDDDWAKRFQRYSHDLAGTRDLRPVYMDSPCQ
jgi:hypothetical protein